MGFFGGLLKFLATILLIGATALTAVVCAGMEQMDVYIFMGVVWLCSFCVSLCFWGAGTALSQVKRLKKQVEVLEQRLYRVLSSKSAPQAPAIGEDFVIPEIPAEPEHEIPRDRYVPRYSQPAERSSKNGWIIGIAAVLAVVAIGATAILMLMNREPDIPVSMEIPGNHSAGMVMDNPDWQPTEAVAETEAAPPAAQVQEVAIGQSVVTDFMEMRFEENIVDADIRHSVTVDRVTRTTGPEPLPGQQYICLSGTITNTSNAPLPVYDFFVGQFLINGYRYEVNRADVLEANGSSESQIDPLMDYKFRIYVAIPDKLAGDIQSASFTYGFHDGFDNQEMAYNRAFSDDPISLCPYQFKVVIR